MREEMQRKEGIRNYAILIGIVLVIGILIGIIKFGRMVEYRNQNLYIETVKNSRLSVCPDKKIEEILEAKFENTGWNCKRIRAGEYAVVFTGDCLYEGADMSIGLGFCYKQKKGLRLEYASFNGVPQEKEEIDRFLREILE